MSKPKKSKKCSGAEAGVAFKGTDEAMDHQMEAMVCIKIAAEIDMLWGALSEPSADFEQVAGEMISHLTERAIEAYKRKIYADLE